MKVDWNEEHYLLSFVAEKLSYKYADLIRFGISRKLKIAAYIYIEAEKVKTYSLCEGKYTYSSGYYYICPQQLKHYEFRESVDNVEACDIIPINTYKDDNTYFYLYSYYVERYDKRQYANTTEETHCFSGDIYLIDDEDVDSHDIVDMKNSIVNVTKPEKDDSDYYNNGINFLATPNYGINYTVHSKDLMVFHDDLIQFLENMPLYHDEQGALLITKSDNSQTNNSYAAINAERMSYLLIITTLSRVIRGEFAGIEKHPILKGSKAESNLIEELAEWKYSGLSKRNLQKIFSEANKIKEPEVSEKALLLAIAAMLEIILGTYPQGKKHLSVSSESNLIIMLPTLEPSLSEVNFQSIFAKAQEIISNA